MWVESYHSPSKLHNHVRLSSVSKKNRDPSLNTTFCQSVTFHVTLEFHITSPLKTESFGVKSRTRKGNLKSRFTSARRLELVWGTIGSPTSDCIVVTARSMIKILVLI
ncbi:uncharacterized protein TNCT_196661 [Trichonephila clavata]|uniref:Uncharacterized protein n=1 Tax=Trichonephila clavata TaxID=2740835 RepID=A0A8X6FIH2_TRICU|nr:uncharacterized protein TNCT_196661 [Trichonephila clavata]